MARYLDALPDGLDTFPDCSSKGSLIRSLLHGHDLEALCDGLPPRLQAVATQPPGAAIWAPAVYNDAIFEALCDLHYPTDAELYARTLDRTVRVARTPAYREILRIPSARIGLRIMSKTHRLFQRGSELEVIASRSHQAVVQLRCPAFLHSRRMLFSNAPMLAGVLRLLGANQPTCNMEQWSKTGAIYRCEWLDE